MGFMGTTVSVEPSFGDHCVVVVFPTLRCRILGTEWGERFHPRELELAE
jgi:hypothetical protein